MVHSVKNRKKREKKMRTLKKRAKGLAKLGSHYKDGIIEIKLPYVALGDLRWRGRQIKIPKDRPLRISGSDGCLLVYVVALNDKELVDNLYQSIQEAPTPKHYVF